MRREVWVVAAAVEADAEPVPVFFGVASTLEEANLILSEVVAAMDRVECALEAGEDPGEADVDMLAGYELYTDRFEPAVYYGGAL